MFPAPSFLLIRDGPVGRTQWRAHFKPGRQSGPGKRCSSVSGAQRARCRPPSEIPRRAPRHRERWELSGQVLSGTPEGVADSLGGEALPARRALGGGRERTERESAYEGDRVQCTGRAAEERARLAEEVRGALAQTQRGPDVVEAQEAAAGERQTRAALWVVHGARRSGWRCTSARLLVRCSEPREPQPPRQSSDDVTQGPAPLGPCK